MGIIEAIFGKRVANSVESFMTTFRESKTGDEVICPYCQQHNTVIGPGKWACAHCNEIFYYKMEFFDISKEDHVLCDLFGMFAKLLREGGKISRVQIDCIERIISEGLELEHIVAIRVKDYFRYAKDNNKSFEYYAMQFYQKAAQCRETQEYCMEALRYLYILAQADGASQGRQLEMIAAAGHLFNLPESVLEGIKQEYYNEDLDTICHLFGMFAKMAKANSPITAAQISEIEKIMLEDLELNKEYTKELKKAFRRAKDEVGTTFETYCAAFYRGMHHKEDANAIFYECMTFMYRIVLAKGAMNGQQEQLFGYASGVFGINAQMMERLKETYGSSMEKYYNVLGCSEQDSLNKVKAAYRKMINEYHPDKLAHMTLPQYLVEHMQEKFREVQEAYEFILQHKQA